MVDANNLLNNLEQKKVGGRNVNVPPINLSLGGNENQNGTASVAPNGNGSSAQGGGLGGRFSDA